MYETLTVESDARGVATVTLNRPDKHNVLNAQTIAELTSVAKVLGDDPDARVVVLTEAGRSFCAGGDLAWMKAQMEATLAVRKGEARKLAEMLFCRVGVKNPR